MDLETAADQLADALQNWMDDPQNRDPDAFNVWVALKAYREARAEAAKVKPQDWAYVARCLESEFVIQHRAGCNDASEEYVADFLRRWVRWAPKP